jgi:hypothetical protein
VLYVPCGTCTGCAFGRHIGIGLSDLLVAAIARRGTARKLKLNVVFHCEGLCRVGHAVQGLYSAGTVHCARCSLRSL